MAKIRQPQSRSRIRTSRRSGSDDHLRNRWAGPITIRPSAIDNYRFCYADAGEYEWPIDKLVARLKEEPDDAGDEKMAFGTHAHACLQTGDFEWLEEMNVLGLDIELFEPQIVEWRHKRTYEIDGREVVMSGQCDAIAGKRIIDYKCTFSAIDLTRYHDALQWRCYLALHQRCQSFRYEVMKFAKTRATKARPSEPFLSEHRFLELHRYDALEQDVYEWVVRYFRFLIDLEDAGWVTLGPKTDGSVGVLTDREERAWRT